MRKSSLSSSFVGRSVVAGLVGTFAWFATASVSAQDLVDIGAGKLPYVLFVLDTSGSTEWTDQGNERYPERIFSGADPLAPAVDNPLEWQAGLEMGVYDPDVGGSIDAGPTAFGPCFVWEPDDCGDYRRPAYFVGSGAPSNWDPRINSEMTARFGQMQGTDSSPGVRLNQLSQPRHVTLKEILSGQMVLAPQGSSLTPETLSPATHGPGCWFVRRQIGASVQPLAEQDYCSSDPGRFRQLPDFDEPRPHFQEVITATKPGSGILKKFARDAVFGVAFMDGYVDDVGGWNPDNLNDDIDGQMPDNAFRGPGNREGNGGNYDLGVYRIVTPEEIDIEPTLLQQLSSFMQVTVNEAGMVGRSGFSNPELTSDDDDDFDWLGLSFDEAADDLMDEYRMGRQPIARATPMAAAVADVHQFFANDARFREAGTPGSKKESDPFARCRQKNVVLITDGTPDPERTGGAGNNIGSSGLTAAFGLDVALYPYDIAEMEIQQMMDNDTIPPASGDGNRLLYGPRVHVVSLDVEQDPARRANVADKLSAMAAEGNTCASHALPAKVQPPEGSCDTGVEWCLVDQPSRSWDPPDGSGSTTCQDPAVMLTSNDPEALEQALDAVLGSIIDVSGTTSRTKTAVTNNLDDAVLTQGGQYRFFSATNSGGGNYWRGILNRQTLPCSGTGDVNYDASDSSEGAGIDSSSINTTAIHDEIAAQIGCAAGDGCGPATDSRRIFTSIPSDALYDYANSRPMSYSSALPGGDTDFHWTYDLAVTNVDDDEFVETSLPAPLDNASFLEDTRVPFLTTYLQRAFENAAGGSWTTDPDFYDYWGTDPADTAEFTTLIDTYRGRIREKAAVSPPRVLGPIVNSDPVAVDPPSLDLPIESYRAFRARYGDRPTMLYFSTREGLLHAVHAGELQERVRIRQKANDRGTDGDASATEGAADQREAWAYLPHMIHRRLSSTVASQPNLLDGPPTVKDVRLCQQNATENQNLRACGVLNDDPMGTLTGEQQWRTVLVQGLGPAGQGYFALDVTRPGGLRPGETTRTLNNPDPIPLWEFDRNWEKQQIDYLLTQPPAAFDRVGPSSSVADTGTDQDTEVLVDTDNDGTDDGTCEDEAPVWQQPLLGTSLSKPEIATVQIESDNAGSPIVRQRPIAVFGGGEVPNIDPECGSAVSGQAIYVVDLQTGTLIRRFVDYVDDGGTRHTFHRSVRDDSGTDVTEAISFAGSPALFNAFTGSVATRGFIGGSNGMLFKIDFSDVDPANWDVSLFFDPYQVTGITDLALDSDGDPVPLGSAGFKPAIARGPDKSLVVTYGLGDPSETTQPGRVQAVITVNEITDTTNPAFPSELKWFEVFPEGEKMTGDPLIFNKVTYFPTYSVPDADICEPGTAKIWALEYFDPETPGTNFSPVGVWNPTDARFAVSEIDVDTDGKWFGPTQPTLIRGLTLTAGPACSVRGLGTDSQDTSGLEGADAQPQLIAQTSGASAGSGLDESRGASGADVVSRLVVDIEKPRSMTVPLSWSVIGN